MLSSNTHMTKHLLLLFFSCFYFFSIEQVSGQCGSTSGVGTFDPIEANFCGGEKEVWIGKRYTSVDVPSGKDVYIQVDWGFLGAGNIEYYPTILVGSSYEIDNTPAVAPPTGPPAPAFGPDRYAYKKYPENLENCEYIVDVTIVFVDAGQNPATHPSSVLCPGTTNSVSTNYWEKDNIAPGSLNIERAPLITICEGQDVEINPLENITTYNCPLSNNDGDRWFQWVYNTDGTNPIPDVVIDGININNEVFNVNPAYTNPDFQEPVQLDPGLNILPGDLEMDPTGKIYIDGSNTAAGQTFDITLRSWNACNPFDDPDIPGTPSFADAANADNDPVETVITIEIVPAPNPDPEVRDNGGSWRDNTNNPAATFCAGDPVRFRHKPGVSGDSYAWDFDWDGDTNNFDENSTSRNANTSYDASYIPNSPIRVGLRITRGNIGEPCVFYESIWIGIENGPIADFSLNNTASCDSIEFTTNNVSVNADAYTWNITQVEGTGGVIDDISVISNDTDLSSIKIVGPGAYEVSLEAVSNTVPCPTIDVKTIYIYDTPEPDFSAAEICDGDATTFTDLSNLDQSINGDAITEWEFVFNFDPTDFVTDPQGTFDSQATITTLTAGDFNSGKYDHTYPAAGEYKVALRVKTDKGACVSKIDTATVIVKNNPASEVEAFYRDDYDSYSAGDVYTGDPICPGTFLNFTNTTDLSLNHASVDPVSYFLEITDFNSVVTTEPIGAPGDANETVEINMFSNTTPSNQTYTVRLVATADNGCVTRSTLINVVVLPADDAGFNIFDGDPLDLLNPPNPYNAGTDYCSPQEFYFQTDGTTQGFNATEYIWTVSDAGTGAVDTTVTITRDPLDEASETFSHIFENKSGAVKTFEIELEVVTGTFCVSNKIRSVKLQPQPSADFTLIQEVKECSYVQFRFETTEKGLAKYIWAVSPSTATVEAGGSTSNDYIVIKVPRQDNGNGDLNFTVDLTTETLTPCSSETKTYNGLVEEKEDIVVDVNFDINNVSESCLPSTYTFKNTTDLTAFTGVTTWEFELTKWDGSAYVIKKIFKGEDYPDPDFSNGIDYDFTEPGKYQLNLVASHESKCIFTLSNPLDITIHDTPIVNFRTNKNQGCSPLSNVIIQNNSSTVSGNTGNFEWNYEVYDPISGTVIQSGGPENGSGVKFSGDTLAPLINTDHEYIDYEITLSAVNPAFTSCIDDSTYVVRVFQEPKLDFKINAPNPACDEDYDFSFEILSTSVYPTGTNFRWNFGDGSTVISQDLTQTHTYNNPNGTGGSITYTVEVTAETPNNCSVSKSDIVELYPIVRPGFILLNKTGCSPSDFEIKGNAQGTGLSYLYERKLQTSATWNTFTSTPDADGDIIETFTNSTSSDQIYEIRQTVTGNGPCSKVSAIQEITVFPKPIKPTISGPSLVCENERNVEYAIIHQTGYTYQWIVPEFAYISSRNTHSDTVKVDFGPVPSDPDPEIMVIVTDANFCKGDTVKFPVNIVPGPTGSIALSGASPICPGDSTTLKFTLNGPGTLGYDVVLYNGFENDTIENINNGDEIWVKPAVSANYSIKEIIDREYSSCPGKPSSNNVRVNVEIAPTATIAGNYTICEGESADLRINLSGLGPWDVEYTDGTDTISVNSSSPAIALTVSPVVSTVYKLVSVSDISCSGNVTADSAVVNVNPAPHAEIFTLQDDAQVCLNVPVEIGVSLFGYGPWAIRFTDGINIFAITDIQPIAGHDPTDSNSSTIHIFEITPQSEITEYKLLEVVDDNGCSAPGSGTAIVKTLPTPEVAMTGNASICEGSSTPLDFVFAKGVAPFTVKMTINDVEDTLIFNGLAANHQEMVSPVETTNYRIFSVIDANGCPANNFGLPVRINVREVPTVVLSASDSICYGEEASLRFDLTGKGPWTVTYNDGTTNKTFNTPYNRHYETVSPTVTTNYTVVSVKDSNTPICESSGSGSASVVVASELVAGFIATPTNMDLPESTITITNTTTNKEEWDYTWDFGDGNTSTEQDPGTHEYETYGTYFVTMKATNGECSDNTQSIITINAIPAIVDFRADIREGCAPLTVNFENLTKYATASTYLWDFGDNQSSRVINPTHTYTQPGIYTVRLSANNITGQPVEEVKTEYITVYETPQSIFRVKSGYSEVFTGEKVEFTNSSIGADQFLWDFGDGNESFEQEPVHVYADSGIYNITLVAINSVTGCTDTLKRESQVLVLTGGDAVVANAFTPNRGGPGSAKNDTKSNDIFLPLVKGVEKYDMKIYNRWGELIFESNDKDVGWDGYYKGKLMPMGVYVFRMELLYENGRREVKLGDVTLIR